MHCLVHRFYTFGIPHFYFVVSCEVFYHAAFLTFHHTSESFDRL